MLPTFAYNINNFINQSYKLGNEAYYPASPHYLSISFMKYETTQRSDLTTRALMKSMFPFRLSSMFIHKTCWTLRDQPVGSVNCLWPVTRVLLGHMPCQTLKDFPHVLVISLNLNMPIWLLTSTVMWAASMPDEVFKQGKAHLNHLLYSFVWLPESKMYFGVVAWDRAKNASQKGEFSFQLTVFSCMFFIQETFDVASLPWTNHCYFFRRLFTISHV